MSEAAVIKAVLWDEPKRLANIEKHGLDFADFRREFDWIAVRILPARPSRTGRPRFKLIGMLRSTGVVVAVVSPLGDEALAVVSLRIASPSERTAYEQA